MPYTLDEAFKLAKQLDNNNIKNINEQTNQEQQFEKQHPFIANEIYR